MAKKRLTQIDRAIADLQQQIRVLELAIQKLREQQTAGTPRKPAIVKSA